MKLAKSLSKEWEVITNGIRWILLSIPRRAQEYNLLNLCIY